MSGNDLKTPANTKQLHRYTGYNMEVKAGVTTLGGVTWAVRGGVAGIGTASLSRL